MHSREYAYIYDPITGTFLPNPNRHNQDDRYSAKELAIRENNGDGLIREYRNNLYLRKNNDTRFKLSLVNSDRPYFKRWPAITGEHQGSASTNESDFHYFLKKGIANLQKIRIMVNGEVLVLSVKKAKTEENIIAMDREYEIDCAICIDNSNDRTIEMIRCDSVLVEIHHWSAVNANKSRDLRLTNHCIYEINANNLIKYFPKRMIDGDIAEAEAIELVTTFFNNPNHFLNGSIWFPTKPIVKWTDLYHGCATYNLHKYDITIYRDRRDTSNYNFYINRDDGHKIHKDLYCGRKMKTINSAKAYANYLIINNTA